MITLQHIRTASKQIGLWPVLATLGKECFFGLKMYLSKSQYPQFSYRLPATDLAFPIFCRALSSDLYVYNQIFVDREYDCTDGIGTPELIVDCGANVGYTSVFFLNKYPRAQVIAVEPEAGNFQLLKRNLSAYGDRATVVNAAVWSTSTSLCIKRDNSGLRQEWGTQVAPAAVGDDSNHLVDAIDIGRLLSESGHRKIDILKLDVEGAESVIFAENYSNWIDKVECFVIELHDEQREQCFFDALSSSDSSYRFSKSGELTVAVREPAAA